ncbi:helix-turn-helix domain-containing protein [Acidiferrobacter sp.]|uniref:helix-turn-helix domain-containing protein n=1 Tax=Acidiferrobacter sp. TaxID=1872107 RepID=UPI00345BF0E9
MSLDEAATFLHMNPEALRQKVKVGQIPGAKIGKRWLFIKTDLEQYIRSRYAYKWQAVRATDQEASCHSTAEAKTASIGYVSRRPTDTEYANLLKRKT